MKAILTGLAVVFIVGWLLGTKHADHKVDFIKIPHTVVTHQTKTVTNTVLPAKCKLAMTEAEAIFDAASNYEGTSGTETDILSAGRVAIAEHNMIAMGKVMTRQNSVEGNSSEDIHVLAETITAYKLDRSACYANLPK